MKRISLVIPWYHDSIGGGAETACRLLAKSLQAQGAEVEILTTCLRDFRSDWAVNHFPEGPASEGGIRVHRFPVTNRNRERFDQVNGKLMANLPVSPEEEQTFLREMINCEALYRFIAEHRSESVLLFLPYLFSTTYWGSAAARENAIHIPCLHDEAYARLPAFREMFARAAGVIFLSRAERDLARTLYPQHRELATLGLPLDCSWTGDAGRFAAKFGLRDFLLYAGRADAGKNADLLIRFFAQYLRDTNADLDLVFIGASNLDLPPELKGRIHSRGFLSEQDKRDCFAASLALAVPSTVESFSIVMMESWTAGRPVIVNARCAVTTAFCRDSHGGLWFADYAEFREILNFLRANPDAARALGQNGAAFVRDHFDAPAVARKYLDVLDVRD